MDIAVLRPNWFDQKYAATLNQATAEQILLAVSTDDQLLAAVKSALAAYDEKSKTVMGPSRLQTARTAIAETLQMPP
jgi:hypothetical protein